MKKLLSLLLFGALLQTGDVRGQQSQDFGDFVVHYSAITTNLLPPEVTKAYALTRSTSQAVLNLTVLKKTMNTPGTPVAARVSANATNLTGQLRDLEMREVVDPNGAVYYISEFPVHNREIYTFEVKVSVEGEENPLLLRFRKQFFTE